MAKQKSTKQIIKKKRWMSIVSPGFLGEKVLGESYLEEGAEVKGRTLIMNLMQVTGDIKAQNNSAKFEITGAKDGKIQTVIVGYEYLISGIKRLIRRRMTRIDDSIVGTTSDGVKIRIKPMIMTRNKVSRSVEQRIRAIAKGETIVFIKKTSYEELFTNVIKNRFQNELKSKLNVIYPLRGVIIRVLKKEKESVLDTDLPKLRASKKSEMDNEEKKEKKKAEKKEQTPEDEIVEETILEEKEEPKPERKPRKKND